MSSPSLSSTAQCLHQLLQAFIEAALGEVDPLQSAQLVLHLAWYLAGLGHHRDDVTLLLLGDVELLHNIFRVNAIRRENNQERITFADSLSNLRAPGVAGLERAAVHPDLHTVVFETLDQVVGKLAVA